MRGSSFVNVVSQPITLDNDAAKFIGIGIETYHEKSAANYLVTELKKASLWTRFNVIYLFVGGTQYSNSFNLKNTAANKITYGGTTFSNANGVTGDGSTGYLETSYTIPAGAQNGFSMGGYCRNNVQGNYCFMGACTNNASAFTQMYLRQSGGGNAYSAEINQTSATATFLNTNSQGFYAGTRTGANVVVAYKNGVAVASDTDASVVPTSVTINGLVRNSNVRGGFALYNIAFGFIMESGLTAPEAATLNNIVQATMIILNKRV